MDQVAAIMDRLTDPNVPAPDKSDIVTPAFTDDELHKVDCMNQRHPGGPLDRHRHPICAQQLRGGYRGQTPGWRVPRPDPIVLVDQNGHWMITHRSAYYLLTYFYIQANQRLNHGLSAPSEILQAFREYGVQVKIELPHSFSGSPWRR